MTFIIYNLHKTSSLLSITMPDVYSILLNMKDTFLLKEKGPLTLGVSQKGVLLVTTQPPASGLALQEIYTHAVGEKEILFLAHILKREKLITDEYFFVKALTRKVVEFRAWYLENNIALNSVHPILKKIQQGKTIQVGEREILKKESLTCGLVKDFPQFFSQVMRPFMFGFYKVKPVPLVSEHSLLIYPLCKRV
jgi:hypothetical protein